MRTTSENFWLDAPYEANPSIDGEHEADVAIIGGGFTGMASAYFIKERFPRKRVILLEGDFIGYGSSGRNSGIVTTLLGHNILPIKKAQGTETTALLHRLSLQSIALLEELIAEHQIDCDYERNGLLMLAETERQVKLLDKKVRAYEDIDGRVNWLDKNKVRSHFGAAKAMAGIYIDDDRALNPGKLARGMKKAAESLGVEVYEHSRCTHVERGPAISLYVPGGRVRARDIVVATNAYNNPLRLFRHKVLPFYVYNIVTDPLTDSQMEAFEWPDRENVYSSNYLFWAMRPTADNRLLFIDNDALYFYNVDRDYSYRPREYRSHYKMMTKMFPFLKGIKIAYQWGGRIGMTLDFLPSVGCTGKHRNIYYSMGYNGHGVAFSHLAGKMIAELMAGEDSTLTNHMLINKSIWGVPSASIMYLATNGYKLFYKGRDYFSIIGK